MKVKGRSEPGAGNSCRTSRSGGGKIGVSDWRQFGLVWRKRDEANDGGGSGVEVIVAEVEAADAGAAEVEAEAVCGGSSSSKSDRTGVMTLLYVMAIFLIVT